MKCSKSVKRGQLSAQFKGQANEIVRAFRTERVLGILRDSETASGPLDGGCLIVAKALQHHLGDGELVRLVSHKNGGQTEHYGLCVGSEIVDGNGRHANAGSWAATFSVRGHFKGELHFEVGYDETSEIPDDPHAVKMLAAELGRRAPRLD